MRQQRRSSLALTPPCFQLRVREGVRTCFTLCVGDRSGPGHDLDGPRRVRAEEIAAIRAMIDKSGRAIRLQVDGGVDRDTAPQCIAAGADVLVAGSASFKGGPEHYAANIAALRGAP